MQALGESEALIDQFFFDWRGGRLRTLDAEPRYAAPVFDRFRQIVANYAPVTISQHEYWRMSEPCSMHIAEVEQIWNEIDNKDDWDAFNRKIAAIRQMGEAMRDTG